VVFPDLGGRPRPPDSRPGNRAVDAGLLWAGGLTTAMVAQLQAAAGMLLSYGLTGRPVLTVVRTGDPLATGCLMACAVLVTLGSTLLLHLLLLAAPEAMLFFRWTSVLITLLAAVGPWLSQAPPPARLFTSLLHLAIGVTVTRLLGLVAAGAVRPHLPTIWQAGAPVTGAVLPGPNNLEFR
jgi:hypothetical protein